MHRCPLCPAEVEVRLVPCKGCQMTFWLPPEPLRAEIPLGTDPE